MKLKIKPSARTKKRYLLIDGKKDEIEKAILDYIGILGWVRASPIFVRLKDENKGIILAVNREEINNIRAAFEILPYKIKVLRVSGTLKGLKK